MNTMIQQSDNSSEKKALNKNSFTIYLSIGILIIAIAIFLIFALGKLAEYITNKTDKYYRTYFMNEEPGFSSPWYVKGLHKVDEGFIYSLNASKEKSVYVLGSSLSSNSIDEGTSNLIDGYVYKMLVCGNGCHRSNRVLINLSETAGIFKEDDIIKYEVSYSSFRNMEKSITESVIDRWGKYTVDEDLSVLENTRLLSPIYEIKLQLIKIQNVWELIVSWWEQINDPETYPYPRGYANYKNNYYNYDAVAESCNYLQEYGDSIIEDIDNLNNKYNEVVEIMYFPKGLQETAYGEKVNNFIDNELIPHLKSKGIRYRDLRNMFNENQFADGVHLSYDAEIIYTEDLDKYINSMILEINK